MASLPEYIGYNLSEGKLALQFSGSAEAINSACHNPGQSIVGPVVDEVLESLILAGVELVGMPQTTRPSPSSIQLLFDIAESPENWCLDASGEASMEITFRFKDNDEEDIERVLDVVDGFDRVYSALNL